MRVLSALLVSSLLLAACGDDTSGGSGGSGGSGAAGGSSTSTTTSSPTTSSAGGAGTGGDTGTGAGGDGTGGSLVACEIPEPTLHIVFVLPDGEVRDSDFSEGGDVDADFVGPITAEEAGYRVTDDATGDVASFFVEGAGGIQVFEDQVVRLGLHYRTRFEGGPDFIQIEIVSDDSDQLIFAALHGGAHDSIDGVRVVAEIGSDTACTESEPGSGAGHSVRSASITIDDLDAVEVASGASADLPSDGFPMWVENQGAIVYVTPPEGYESITVVGNVAFPED